MSRRDQSHPSEQRLLKTLREFIPPNRLGEVFDDIHSLIKAWDYRCRAEAATHKWREDHAYSTLIQSIKSQPCGGGEENETAGVSHVDASYPFREGHRPDWSLRLAQTLRDTKNAQVSTLHISFEEFASGSNRNQENCNAWTSYIRESGVLRNIHVLARSCWSVRPLYFNRERMEQALYEAIAANPGLEVGHFTGHTLWVGEAKLDLKHFLPLLQTKPTLRGLHIETRVLGHDRDHAAFAEALGANRSLRTVTMLLSSDRDSSLFSRLALIPSVEEASRPL